MTIRIEQINLIFLMLLSLFVYQFRYIDILNINVFSILIVIYLLINIRVLGFYRAYIPILLLIAYVAVQAVFIDVRIKSLLLFISTVLLCILFGSHIVKNNSLNKFIKYIVAFEIVHILLALTQKSFGYASLIPSYVFGYIPQVDDLFFKRPPGLSIIPADFHLFTLTLIAYMYAKKKFIALILIVVAISLINYSKSYPLVILNFLFFISLSIYSLKKGNVTVAFVLFFSGILLLNLASIFFVVSEYIKTPNMINTYTSRGAYAVYTYHFLIDNLFFGIGLDNFKGQILGLSSELGMISVANNPHNIWFKFLSELGIVGFFLFFWMLLYVVYRLLSIIREKFFLNKDPVQEVLILSSLFLVLSVSSFHNYHFYNNLYVLLGVSIGLLYKCRSYA
jgi:hypothetical protein